MTIRIPTQYFQADPRWGNISYSAQGESTTIARAGCGPTCAAMVIASLKDPDVTPADTAKWSLSHGYKAPRQGTYYSYFVPQLKTYGIEAKQLNALNIYKKTDAAARVVHAAINKALKRGNWVVACMGKGNWTTSGHFVLAYRTDGEHVWIHDPASTKAGRIYNSLDFWENQIKYAWEVEVPQAEKDDEVVEKKTMAILGQEVQIPTIFKDGKNYVSIRELCEAMGLQVTSSGSAPIVSMGTLKLRIKGVEKTLSGINANGVTYAAVRALAESLGYEAGWDKSSGTVTIE